MLGRPDIGGRSRASTYGRDVSPGTSAGKPLKVQATECAADETLMDITRFVGVLGFLPLVAIWVFAILIAGPLWGASSSASTSR